MYLSYIHFSPLHSPASPQHHLSPWKPLQNDSYLSKWPNLALFSSPIMIFPFESLPSLDFHGLVALSPLWIFPEYFSLCSHPLLSPTFPYILESSGVLYPSSGSFSPRQVWNSPVHQWLAGICLLFSSPSLLICIFHHLPEVSIRIFFHLGSTD